MHANARSLVCHSPFNITARVGNFRRRNSVRMRFVRFCLYPIGADTIQELVLPVEHCSQVVRTKRFAKAMQQHAQERERTLNQEATKRTNSHIVAIVVTMHTPLSCIQYPFELAEFCAPLSPETANRSLIYIISFRFSFFIHFGQSKRKLHSIFH